MGLREVVIKRIIKVSVCKKIWVGCGKMRGYFKEVVVRNIGFEFVKCWFFII